MKKDFSALCLLHHAQGVLYPCAPAITPTEAPALPTAQGSFGERGAESRNKGG